MDTLTRRRFLLASGVVGGTALAAGAGVLTMSDLHKRALGDPLPSGTKVLVLVTLYGGNDGLNTLIPYADPAYHDARADLAYAEDEVLHLDERVGLNPAMTAMADLWKQRKLAIVQGVGYPKPDHSHFRSMDIWQTASPDAPVNTGWIGRWLDATGDDPVRAVNIGSVLPPLAVGARSTAAALSVGTRQALTKELTDALQQLGTVDPADHDAMTAVTASYRAERQVASTFGPVNGQATGTNKNDLGEQLDLVGRCVKAGVPTRVYAVSLGGFDTHADEKADQQALLETVDTALAAFLVDMAGDPRGQGVVAMMYSEFGRRVAANASQGTDHGTAGPVFVAGAPVRGGFYGSQPSLTDLDDGDLKASTDFRVVYGELVHRVLGGDPVQILGSARPELGFVQR